MEVKKVKIVFITENNFNFYFNYRVHKKYNNVVSGTGYFFCLRWITTFVRYA